MPGFLTAVNEDLEPRWLVVEPVEFDAAPRPEPHRDTRALEYDCGNGVLRRRFHGIGRARRAYFGYYVQRKDTSSQHFTRILLEPTLSTMTRGGQRPSRRIEQEAL